MLRWASVSMVLVAIFCFMDTVNSCNEAVCASVVSKCMLTQSCKCDLKNCSCCKECFYCLGELYSECCSCVDMCPKPNDTGSALSKKSHVEMFSDPVPALFAALMSEPDTQQRWITFTFPVDFYTDSYRPKLEKEFKYWTHTRRWIKSKSTIRSIRDQVSNLSKTAESAEQEVAPVKDVITLNCTVAYMSQCMSWNKCKQSCKSTGAQSYRWFHDGCCECVGETCINFGIDESRCLNCPMQKEEEEEEDEDEASYIYDNEEYEHKEKDSPKSQ